MLQGRGGELEGVLFGLDKENVTISPDGGSVDVVVYSNNKWEISCTSDWCTPSVNTGDANEDGQKVTFSADVAYDDREATFWFHCADEKIKLVVSQKSKAVIIPDANNTFDIPAEGGVAVILYKTTVDCEVIIPEEAQDWITIAPATRGLATYNTTLNITSNISGKLRSSVVKVVSQDNNELFAEYTISQESRYCLCYTSSDGKIITPTEISFGATILSNTYKDGIGVIEFDAPITSIGDGAFLECSSLTSVTIPNSVTSIGMAAFWECSSLTNLIIGNSVTSIGEAAFWECSSLTNLIIGDSVTSIGEAAFWECSSLTNLIIGDSVTSIGNLAFRECSSLTSVTIPDNVTLIGNSAFWECSSLTDLIIGDSVTSIGDGAFVSCSSLTSVTIPDSVTSIGEAAFWECSSLTNLIIGNSVTSIGDGAFVSCSSLTSVTIPDSVTSIGNLAFYGCSNLQELNGKFTSEDGRCLIIEGVLNSFAPAGLTEYSIPDSVTSIGDQAFASCSSLTSVTIPNSVTSIGNLAFAGCSNLQEFNGKFTSEDGRCLIIEGVLNSFAPAGLTEYSIPDSVTSIGESAFIKCGNLTSITIPNSVTSIGDQAFIKCGSLTSITIPNSVTSIGNRAFQECSSLTDLIIGNSVTLIGDYAFASCSSLTSVTIPDSVTSIGYGAFSDCI